MRKKLIAGNWKMYKSPAEAAELAEELKRSIGSVTEVDVLVCPPFVDLDRVKHALDGSVIKLGAQDVYWENEGAFTGEISAQMLKEAGCEYVIAGHSERRHIFGDTNEEVNRKAKALLAAGLKPIVCIGEKIEEREAGQTEAVLEEQTRNSLAGIDGESFKNIVIAYEPVWAIGTGKTATPEIAEQAHKFVRSLIESITDSETAKRQIILYGGSVKPDNVKELMNESDIDGALVGGASLKSDSFTKIVRYFE